MADLDRLLVQTSRTFALSIPLLAEPLRTEVGIAYLLFRVADTFEDATSWHRADRVEALCAFASILKDSEESHRPNSRAAKVALLADKWAKARPCDHEGYLELIGELPGVLSALDKSAPAKREAVLHHTLRTTEGMADFVAWGKADGSLSLTSLADLRRYCYVVAGIVGELLTELFLLETPALAVAKAALTENAAAFGEGLQLVNILKDADSDAKHGRVYLPPGVSRAEVSALARRDLDAAAGYVNALQTSGAPRGVVAFTALPVLLARATLDELDRAGAGAKISRAAVAALMTHLDRSLDLGTPAIAC